MRNSLSSLLAAAIVAFGLSVGGPTSANAESVMKACASQWKQAQATGATSGQSWPQFLAQCRATQGSPTSTTAPAPAPQSGSLFPWSQPRRLPRRPQTSAAAQSVMRLCASQWKDAKAAGTTGGESWPQFLAQCRARQGSTAASGGFAPAPAPRLPRRQRPPLSQALCSHGGSSQLRLPRQAHPQRREQANTPPNSRRERGARQTQSCGPIRHLASITTQEPAITGAPAGARICARLTRAPPDIARRRTANVRLARRLGSDGVWPGR